MLRASRTLHILYATALLEGILGCTESESAPTREQRPRIGLSVHLSADNAASIGISTAPVRVQTLRPTIKTTG